MPRRILVITAHPDPAPERLCRALAEAYASSAEAAGHEVRRVDIARLDFPLLRSTEQFERGRMPEELKEAAEAIVWAEHVLFVFPLWLGTMPALLKGFLEQVARPGFALSRSSEGGPPKKMLAGRSARVVVTMGMQALVYRWYFRAHSLKALERNMLGFVGFAPIHETLVGNVEGQSDQQREAWLGKLRRLGQEGA